MNQPPLQRGPKGGANAPLQTRQRESTTQGERLVTAARKGQALPGGWRRATWFCPACGEPLSPNALECSACRARREYMQAVMRKAEADMKRIAPHIEAMSRQVFRAFEGTSS